MNKHIFIDGDEFRKILKRKYGTYESAAEVCGLSKGVLCTYKNNGFFPKRSLSNMKELFTKRELEKIIIPAPIPVQTILAEAKTPAMTDEEKIEMISNLNTLVEAMVTKTITKFLEMGIIEGSGDNSNDAAKQILIKLGTLELMQSRNNQAIYRIARELGIPVTAVSE